MPVDESGHRYRLSLNRRIKVSQHPSGNLFRTHKVLSQNPVDSVIRCDDFYR